MNFQETVEFAIVEARRAVSKLSKVYDTANRVDLVGEKTIRELDGAIQHLQDALRLLDQIPRG